MHGLWNTSLGVVPSKFQAISKYYNSSPVHILVIKLNNIISVLESQVKADSLLRTFLTCSLDIIIIYNQV